MYYRPIFLGLAAALLFLGSIAGRAGGSVTNCTEAALRVALRGGGLVTVACDTSIAVTDSIVVSQDTVIDGTGHAVVLTGNTVTNLSHLFVVEAGIRLTLRNLTLTGGRMVGADGEAGQDGETAFGAGIYNRGGIVTLQGCILSDHQVTGGVGATATKSSQAGHRAGSGLGSAIFNDGGQLTVTNSVFLSNTATGGVGGEGAAGLDSGNGSSGGDGGTGGTGAGAAIYNTRDGQVGIFDSSFSSNRVTGVSGGIGGAGVGYLGFAGKPGESGNALGAALFNDSGVISIQNSTFAANSATGSTGGPGHPGTDLIQAGNGTTGGSAQGGAIFNHQGILSLTNCTLVDNAVLGGKGGEGGTGRSGGFGGDGGNGGRGGMAAGAGLCTDTGGSTFVVNSTFTGNRVTGGPGGAGGSSGGLGDSGKKGPAGTGDGSAVYNGAGTLELRNSILSGRASVPNAGGAIRDAGYNLSSDASPVFTQAGSRNGLDPLLGGFLPAGGMVPTMTLSSNSPAIDAIGALDGNGAPSFDQRNARRTPPYDIGAFEYNGTLTGLTLQAERLTSQVRLSWPAAGSTVLQSAATLSGVTTWVTVTNQPTTNGSARILTVNRTNSANFYRLSAP